MCETRASGPHRVLPELLDIIAGYCARSDLVNLGLVCKDWYSIVIPRLWRHVRIKTSIDCTNYCHWIVTVESPFEPWLLPLLPLLPNLRELFLHDVKILGNALAALFDLNIRVLKLDISNNVDYWDFYWDPSVDRACARSFLHRLVSINFGNGMHDRDTDITIIQDAIHEELQKIHFGMSFNLPFNLLSAPHHLTVICATYPENPASFFEIIADHCPHLRALSCLDLVWCADNEPNPLVESFRYFIKQRGAQLVALQYSMTQGGIEE
ncbi:hypothetical protein HK102_006838, partial [Quaeritorhiza haematococci]